MTDREARIRAAIDAKHKEVGDDHAVQLEGLKEKPIKHDNKNKVHVGVKSGRTPFRRGYGKFT